MTCIPTFSTQEGPALKKLSDAVDRFCYRHPRFGVPDLMRFIVIGNVVVYLLAMVRQRVLPVSVQNTRS